MPLVAEKLCARVSDYLSRRISQVARASREYNKAERLKLIDEVFHKARKLIDNEDLKPHEYRDLA